MSEKARSARDAFTFSLSGFRAMAGYAAAVAIADDRINKAWDERLSSERKEAPDDARQTGAVSGRFWLSRRHRTA